MEVHLVEEADAGGGPEHYVDAEDDEVVAEPAGGMVHW